MSFCFDAYAGYFPETSLRPESKSKPPRGFLGEVLATLRQVPPFRVGGFHNLVKLVVKAAGFPFRICPTP